MVPRCSLTVVSLEKMGSSSLTLYRNILKELRSLHPKGKLLDSPVHQYVRKQFQDHKITTEILCKSKHEVQYVAETYLCMLQSTKKYEELHTLYKGAGERSIESAANLVGLKLPKSSNPDKKD